MVSESVFLQSHGTAEPILQPRGQRFQNRRQASKQQQSPEQLSSPGLYSQGSEDQAFSGASTPVATSEYLEASSAATPSTEAGSLGFLRDTEDEAH